LNPLDKSHTARGNFAARVSGSLKLSCASQWQQRGGPLSYAAELKADRSLVQQLAIPTGYWTPWWMDLAQNQTLAAMRHGQRRLGAATSGCAQKSQWRTLKKQDTRQGHQFFTSNHGRMMSQKTGLGRRNPEQRRGWGGCPPSINSVACVLPAISSCSRCAP